MHYQSTRNTLLRLNGLDALNQGLSEDGGLLVPLCFPLFEMEEFLSMDYPSISTHILSAFFDEFDPEDLKRCVHEAYRDSFNTPEITPMVKVNGTYVLELFHGPTAAFKDIALQLLPRLLAQIKEDRYDTTLTAILTATSGDTGSAAINGFKDVPGFTISVFYPEIGISQVQRKQMTTVNAKNVHVYGIKGNFDDAQRGVKNIFAHSNEFPMALSSANSINIGRLLPQVAYYFKAYASLVNSGDIRLGDEVVFSVPTGNFGNILAGYIAKSCGCPIKKLLCASNENDVLTDFLKTGTYDRKRTFKVTTSPSMDILVSSNLERLLYWLSACDDMIIKSMMHDLEVMGSYTLNQDVFEKLQSVFIGSKTTEDQCSKVIHDIYEQSAYLLDPHSAVGMHAARSYQVSNPEDTVIVLATASPYKFPLTVLKALDVTTFEDEFKNLDRLFEFTHFPMPEFLKLLSQTPEVHTRIIEPSDMKNMIKGDHNGL